MLLGPLASGKQLEVGELRVRSVWGRSTFGLPYTLAREGLQLSGCWCESGLSAVSHCWKQLSPAFETAASLRSSRCFVESWFQAAQLQTF